MFRFRQEVRWVFLPVLAQKSRNFALGNPTPFSPIVKETPLSLAVPIRGDHHREMLGDGHVLRTPLVRVCGCRGFAKCGCVIVC